MNQKELQEVFIKYTDPNSIDDVKNVLEIFSKFFMGTISRSHKSIESIQDEGDGRIIFQMIFTKLLSVEKLLDGVKYHKEGVGSLRSVIDPMTIAVIIRSVYETVCLFNLLYCNVQNKEHQIIIRNLWMISGLLTRQKYVSDLTQEANRVKANLELVKLNELKEEILSSETFANLKPKSKKTLLKFMSSHIYLVKIEDDNVFEIKWNNVYEIVGIKNYIFKNIYSYFSTRTHPSYVSVFQFNDMFKEDGEFKSNAQFNVEILFGLLGVFIADYCKAFPNSIIYFNQLEKIEQIIIDHYNRFYRGFEYSINNSYDSLG
jgi:hypothetical protein